MAHEFESGFFTREGAWHGLGTVLEEAPTIQEGLKQAGLDWTVVPAPVMASIKLPGAPPRSKRLEDHQAMVRSTDGSVLGVVGSAYTPLQNTEAFDFFEPFLQDGSAHLEAAGSLREGRIVWVLAKLGEDDVTEGDQVNSYLLLSNSHDGSRAVQISYTPIRVVCMNTLQAAQPKDAEGVLRARHHKNVGEAVDSIRDMLALADRTFRCSIDEYRAMREKGIRVEGLRRYVQTVFRPEEARRTAMLEAAMEAANRELPPILPREEVARKDEQREELVAEYMDTEEVELHAAGEAIDAIAAEWQASMAHRVPRSYERIEELFEAGPGADLAGKTVWGAYNAVTRWLDHEKGGSDEQRMKDSWFGYRHEAGTIATRSRAHQAALELL